MFNAISSSDSVAVSPVHRRKVSKDPNFVPASGSYAVRQGLMAAPEPKLPRGFQSTRSTRRIPCSLLVHLDGKWQRVAGDVSSTGALVLLPFELKSDVVDLCVQLPSGAQQTIRAKVIAFDVRPRRYGYHLRFAEPNRVAELDGVIANALKAGSTYVSLA